MSIAAGNIPFFRSFLSSVECLGVSAMHTRTRVAFIKRAADRASARRRLDLETRGSAAAGCIGQGQLGLLVNWNSPVPPFTANEAGGD